MGSGLERGTARGAEGSVKGGVEGGVSVSTQREPGTGSRARPKHRSGHEYSRAGVCLNEFTYKRACARVYGSVYVYMYVYK